MNFYDLTHPITNNMPVHPGDPNPEFSQIAFADIDGYNSFQIKTSMHVGTHMDAPFHMLTNGKRILDYPPERFFGKGHLIDARHQTSIDAPLLKNLHISEGDMVLVMTGFYKKFGTAEYFEDYPEITEAFSLKMIEFRVKLVGMDTPSPDRHPFAIHRLLFSHDILIVENLTNLEALLEHTSFRVTALPAKFDADAAPVRVIAGVPYVATSP